MVKTETNSIQHTPTDALRERADIIRPYKGYAIYRACSNIQPASPLISLFANRFRRAD